MGWWQLQSYLCCVGHTTYYCLILDTQCFRVLLETDTPPLIVNVDDRNIILTSSTFSGVSGILSNLACSLIVTHYWRVILLKDLISISPSGIKRAYLDVHSSFWIIWVLLLLYLLILGCQRAVDVASKTTWLRLPGR